jgi:radical SAM protein with 4Fe4S-binding SPASM domain
MSLKWRKISRQLTYNASVLRRPLTAGFELTSRCNLRCKMCYVSSPKENSEKKAKELTAEQWIKLAEMARDAGVLYVTLTGGEVLLRKDFREIYEAISSMGFVTQIYTNATLITPEIASWLKEMPPYRVSLTVYGASADTYEKVCGVRSGYKNVLRGIELLQQEGINYEIKTTAIKDNWREFEAIGDLARKYGVRFGVVNYISPRREGCYSSPEEVRLTPEEVVEYEAAITEYDNKYTDKTIINEEYDESIIQMLEKPADYKENAFSCQAAKSSLWLTWDGRMTPCGLMSEPYALPLEIGFEKAWEELVKKCDEIPECKACSNCEIKNYCDRCPARRKLESGSYDKPASYLCETARRRKEARMKNRD